MTVLFLAALAVHTAAVFWLGMSIGRRAKGKLKKAASDGAEAIHAGLEQRDRKAEAV